MNKTSTVQQRMETYLRQRGVRVKYATDAGLRAVTAAEAKELGSPWKHDAISIPYYDPLYRAKKHRNLVRFRYLSDPLPKSRDGKTAKFGQPRGSEVEAYFDPNVDWKKVKEDTNIPLYFVEGEIKALAMNQCGLVTIGVGGVNNYGGEDLTAWIRQVLQ
jgi:hypothetical protein